MYNTTLPDRQLPAKKQRDAKNAQADGISSSTVRMASRGFVYFERKYDELGLFSAT